MGKPRIPFGFEDIPTKPEMSPQPLISDDIQQTLATLVCYDGETRRLVRGTKQGKLQVVNPLAALFVNISATEGNFLWQGSEIKTSEVVVRAHPDNSGRVWVNVFAAAAADTGWPLDANEHITLTLNSLSHLHLKIITNAEKVILLYTQ